MKAISIRQVAEKPIINLPDSTVAELNRITKAELWLTRIEPEYSKLPDVTTVEGLRVGKERLAKLVKAINVIDKARLAATKPLRDEVDMINHAVMKGIDPRMLELKKPLQQAINEVLASEAIKKADADKEEKDRLHAIRHDIEEIQLQSHRVENVEQCEKSIEWLESLDSEDFEEFAGEAYDAIERQRKVLESKLAQYLARAEELAELESDNNNTPDDDPVKATMAEIEEVAEQMSDRVVELSTQAVTKRTASTPQQVSGGNATASEVQNPPQAYRNSSIRGSDVILTDEWILQLMKVPVPDGVTDVRCAEVIRILRERFEGARKYIVAEEA